MQDRLFLVDFDIGAGTELVLAVAAEIVIQLFGCCTTDGCEGWIGTDC